MYSLYCFCESGSWWLGLVPMDYNPTESQGKLLTFRLFPSVCKFVARHKRALYGIKHLNVCVND